MQILIIRWIRYQALVVVATLIGATALLHATPTEELAIARKVFRTGEYQAALGRLSTLLYPTIRLAGASSIAEAHLLLGVCFLETGHPDSAQREFEEALFLDDSLILTANLFSSEAIAFFNRIAASQKENARDTAEKEKLARKQQALQRAFQNLVVFEKRRYWVNFMPFGAGQFQNGQINKGISFFIAETLTGGTAVGIWSYQVIRYGFFGRVPRDEVDAVNSLQILQIGAGALFYAVLAWGIIDSLTNYEHVVKREVNPSLFKDLREGFENDSPPKMSIAPMIGPDIGGISLQWKY